MKFLLFLVLAVTVVESQQWACPSSVNNLTPNGVPYYIPYQTKAAAPIPANYKCDYKFTIPAGSVIKMTISSHIDDKDTYYYTNVLGDINQLPKTGNKFVKGAPATNMSFSISTTTDQSFLLVKFDVIDFSSLASNQKASSSFISAASVQGKPITFVASSWSNKLKLTAASDPFYPDDPALGDIFIYDGQNVKSNFLGTMEDADDVVSSYAYITLINPFDTVAYSQIVVNDAQDLDGITHYEAVVLRELNGPQTFTRNAYSQVTAVTVILPDGADVYLDDLHFGAASSGTGSVGIVRHGVTGNNLNSPIINYKTLDYNKNNYPQHIPTNFMTLLIQDATAIFTLAPTHANYGTPFIGRRGFVYSRSYWNYNDFSTYDFVMDGGSTRYNFTSQVMLYTPGQLNQYMALLVFDGQNLVNNNTFTTLLGMKWNGAITGTKLETKVVNEGYRGAQSIVRFAVDSVK